MGAISRSPVGIPGKYNSISNYKPVRVLSSSPAAQQIEQAYAPPGVVSTVPTFEQQKVGLMAQTVADVRQTNQSSTVVVDNSPLINRGRQIDIYNRGRFPSLKNITRPRRQSE